MAQARHVGGGGSRPATTPAARTQTSNGNFTCTPTSRDTFTNMQHGRGSRDHDGQVCISSDVKVDGSGTTFHFRSDSPGSA